jgi:hypothetical protein
MPRRLLRQGRAQRFRPELIEDGFQGLHAGRWCSSRMRVAVFSSVAAPLVVPSFDRCYLIGHKWKPANGNVVTTTTIPARRLVIRVI